MIFDHSVVGAGVDDDDVVVVRGQKVVPDSVGYHDTDHAVAVGIGDVDVGADYDGNHVGIDRAAVDVGTGDIRVGTDDGVWSRDNHRAAYWVALILGVDAAVDMVDGVLIA